MKDKFGGCHFSRAFLCIIVSPKAIRALFIQCSFHSNALWTQFVQCGQVLPCVCAYQNTFASLSGTISVASEAIESRRTMRKVPKKPTRKHVGLQGDHKAYHGCLKGAEVGRKRDRRWFRTLPKLQKVAISGVFTRLCWVPPANEITCRLRIAIDFMTLREAPRGARKAAKRLRTPSCTDRCASIW